MAGKLTLSVSQLNEYVKRTLQMDPMLHGVELRGEISNLKFHQTGTLFFTLKDELAAISCVMYATDVEQLSSMPFEGMRALVSGSVGLYVRGGQMQFYAARLHAEGVGVLYERLLALKNRLSKEGLFDPQRKRPLPLLPDTIGVVSSPTGAVIHDIMNVSLRRDPQTRILLCPVRVQGIGAADEVVQAIALLEQLEHVSVIIIARGGGSMEDLWTFNEERVARAVARCRKPVVSAIGHETDVTLCDLAADLRAPTPSAAAECVVPVRFELYAQLDMRLNALSRAAQNQCAVKEARLRLLETKLAMMRPAVKLDSSAKDLDRLCARLREGVRRQIRLQEDRLARAEREIGILNPYHVLSRGYAMVLADGRPVRDAGQLAPGEAVTLRFAQGSAEASISRILNEEKDS
ncbi:MAG: exodeoxyribonuclease VII large subunit [Clostridia bacterium]|nr:exodeoxyribonuclease VII large subunit [Clostridia bacterium]